MIVYVAGAGKLATELLAAMTPPPRSEILPWRAGASTSAPAIVVHAGSGRQLPELIAFCIASGSILIDTATTSAPSLADPCPFPYIDCPNTNLMILRFMAMLQGWGRSFKDYDIQILESHQQAKTSPPGTAHAIAQSLDVPQEQVVSVRSPEAQRELGIPEEHLSRHAFHRIVIADAFGSLTLETKILGPAPYAAGMSTIIAALTNQTLAPGLYSILDLVQDGTL